MRYATWVLAALAVGMAAPALGAQERPPRRQEPIEIRGTVPTPQVVTVRPREEPAYSRKVLVPTFYDRDFWPSILPGYMLVAERMISTQAPMDTTLAADTLRRAMPAVRDSLGVMRDTLGRRVPPPARIDTMPLRPDTARVLPPAQRVPPPALEEQSLSHALQRSRAVGTASASSTSR